MTVNAGPDPFVLFAEWLEHALARRSTANAMSLATATPSGETSLRTVLLKAYANDGFLFFTSPETRKARQMTENPHVSLLFFWPEFNRQIRIDGMAARISMTTVGRRVLAKQGRQGALTWVSPLGRVEETRRALEATMGEVLGLFHRHSGVDSRPAASSVAGFLVSPITIEFWQGGDGLQHASVEYRRSSERWDHRTFGQ